MIFTTEPFAIFAALVFPAYFLAPSARAQNTVTLVASYVFYGWWDWRFCALIAASTLINFVLAPFARRERWALWLAVALNLGLLGVFKYLGFFLDQTVALLQALGVGAHRPTLEILLPVGISFFTFQALSYVIDVARGRIAPEPRLLNFATYIALFPQLVAGPVVRAARLLPQLARARRFSWPNFWIGAEQVLIGLVLKLVVADRLAPLADRAFAHPGMLDSGALALGVGFFALQIYGDFAGYSLIAIGLGRIMGLAFPVNFRRPYLATSFSDFWRRWHISLSRWLRDYLYIPLGGNRRAPARNLMATMVLGGLWHGAGWPFVVWGALHGGYLALARRVPLPRNRWGARAVVLAAVCLAWVFFRAGDLATAQTVLSGLFAFDGASLAGLGPRGAVLAGCAVAAVLLISEAMREDSATLRRALHRRPVRLVRAAAFTLSLPLFGSFGGGAFVYFQF